MKIARTWLAAMATACFMATAAASNVTDHWYMPEESGWGLSVTQQDDVAYVVMFVYGPNGEPTWLASAAQRYGYREGGHPGFAGPLHRMTGSPSGAPFDPTKASATLVGNLTLESFDHDRATLAYSVDGVSHIKTVQRLTFRYKDWSGVYRGVARANYRDCAATFTPVFTYDDGLIDIEHEGPKFRMWFEGKKATCMYTGTYSQHGRMGKVAGSYVCADGPSGTFTIDGLESIERAIGARIVASHPSCSVTTLDLAGFSLQSVD